MMTHVHFRILGLAVLALLLSPAVASAQEKNSDKITAATERSKRATEVLKLIAALPEDKGIPKDIRDEMNLIGVIPDSLRLSLLFSKGYRGRGLSCLKKDGVWSSPAFYFFGASFGVAFTGVGSKHPDIIMIVVNAPTEVKKRDKSKPKPKKDDPNRPQAYIYTFADGILKPLGIIPTSMFTPFTGAGANFVYDDNLNKAIYGVKGDDVLTGNYDKAKTLLPPEITAFQDTLEQVFPKK